MTDTYVRPEDVGKPSDDKGWLEPESAANVDVQPEYPYNNITMTESGHFLEMDDTPGRERVRLQHRSGTFMEMHPDGAEVHKILGDGYEIVAKDKNVLIKGTCNITINGDAILDIKGNKFEKIAGDYEQYIEGNYTQVVKKSAKVLSNEDMTIGSNSSLTGSLRLSTGGEVYMSSDLNVAGEIVADKIASLTRIDAGTGVNAGPLGFVTVFGGVSVGVPFAAPGTVTAPIGNFGLMTALIMTDFLNVGLHNIHFHFAPLGPTSTPIPTMF